MHSEPEVCPIRGVRYDDLPNIGAPLPTCVSASGSRDENGFKVEGAFYPLCLFQESFRLELYSFTDENLKTFSADSVRSLVNRDHDTISKQLGFGTHARRSSLLWPAAQHSRRSSNGNASAL